MKEIEKFEAGHYEAGYNYNYFVPNNINDEWKWEDPIIARLLEKAKRKPIYFVMRDASVANDNVIDNFEQIFKHYSPDTNCRII